MFISQEYIALILAVMVFLGYLFGILLGLSTTVWDLDPISNSKDEFEGIPKEQWAEWAANWYPMDDVWMNNDWIDHDPEDVIEDLERQADNFNRIIGKHPQKIRL